MEGYLPLGTYHLAMAVTLWHRSAPWLFYDGDLMISTAFAGAEAILLSLFCMTAY